MSENIFSLSEIILLCKKACKGAELYWGQSEEIANSIRQLATYGINVFPWFADLVENGPMKLSSIAQSVCHLNDYSHQIADNPLIYKNVDYPILFYLLYHMPHSL